ncbi:MAG: winged helix-turn-helix transcriptional regulator [Patescibacteria group bacterium]|nr:winged helix-turn-helix transcriptional regulator [Patescibacteria group bacterium]
MPSNNIINKIDNKSDPGGGLVDAVLSFMDTVRGDVQDSLAGGACSFMHVKALSIIDRLKEPSMKEVADKLNITSPGATMVVEKLVDEKELERTSDENDRRVIRLKLTAKGRETLKKGSGLIRNSIERRLSALTTTDQDRLKSLLNKLV